MSEGILLINKPTGITSHDVVDAVRRITGIRKVGHAGTLDPLAEGLLVVLVGKSATRRQAEFMAGEKEYRAVMRLGAWSSTDDAEGRITEVPKSKVQSPNEDTIRHTLAEFVGEIEQVPPVYSAIKMRGKKAYEMAREGQQPEMKPRTVTIRELELLEYTWPQIRLRIVCSKGTYIRSLARDIGEKLEVGGYLTALTRTRSGSLKLEDAIALHDLTEENWMQYLHS